MFENVGRQLDRWYWVRMLVAAWLLLCGLILGGYALLGYLFLRFLIWAFFAILALFLPVVNPISFDEFLAPPIEYVEVDIIEEEPEPLDWAIDEPEWVMDIAPPPLPPEPDPTELRRAEIREAVVTSGLLAKIIGTTGSSDGALMDVFGSPNGEMGALGGLTGSSIGSVEGLGSLTTLDAVGGGVGVGVGGLGTRGTGGGGTVAYGGSGVEGGVVGGVIGGAPGGGGVVDLNSNRAPVRVGPGAVTFRRQFMPDELARVSCRVHITFEPSGRVRHASPVGCPDELKHQVRRAASRWRIQPYQRDGAAIAVRTTIQLPLGS